MLLSFFGEPALKAAVRHRVTEHRRLDQIVQGTYWEDGRGCFIGCSLHSNRHSDFERLLGLPEWLARLGEGIFEGLPRNEAIDFPLALYDAIPVGADLGPVKARFLAWLILDEEHGMVRLNNDPRVAAVGEAWLASLRGEAVNWGVLFKAAVAAEAAAWPAAGTAWPAAGTAAWAARAAAVAARAAAEAAWAAWAAAEAAWAAWAAAKEAQRYKLIELLSATTAKDGIAPQLPSEPYFIRYYREVQAEAAR